LTFLSETSEHRICRRGIAQPAGQSLPQDFLAMLAELERLHAAEDDKAGSGR
jgi:hypothetical protein